jgi:1,4-alpha-glucan branching enzyme
MDYQLGADEIGSYADHVNRVLGQHGQPSVPSPTLAVPINQLKALVDILHLNGIAVILQIVQSHAGFEIDGQWESIYFLDRAPGVNPNDSQFFTDQKHLGPIFAFWKQEVRQFLIDNVGFFLSEYHIDGFRHDRVDVIIDQNHPAGFTYCQHMTGTAHAMKPSAIHVAEHWPAEPWVTRSAFEGGAGFDAVWHDSLRNAIRSAIGGAASGRDTNLDLGWVANSLDPIRNFGFSPAWRAVQCLENHDEVYKDRGPRARIPALADGSDARSWYACSRARVAMGLLLTAPGIPLLFMGQEFLESRPWGDNPDFDPLIDWESLDRGDKAMSDYLRFCQELIRLRRRHPALRGDPVNVFHVNELDRVLAFHRWLEGSGRDVIVIASLREETFFSYSLGLPRPGRWFEAFNADVYQNWVNPSVSGNGGEVWADGPPMHRFAHSASVVIPANGVIVLTIDHGD